LNSRSNCLYPRTSCLRRTGQKTWYRTREVLPEEVELELELLEEPLDELLEDPFEELFEPPELELLEDTAGPPRSLKVFSF
jgi:hypothetical protein